MLGRRVTGPGAQRRPRTRALYHWIKTRLSCKRRLGIECPLGRAAHIVSMLAKVAKACSQVPRKRLRQPLYSCLRPPSATISRIVGSSFRCRPALIWKRVLSISSGCGMRSRSWAARGGARSAAAGYDPASREAPAQLGLAPLARRAAPSAGCMVQLHLDTSLQAHHNSSTPADAAPPPATGWPSHLDGDALHQAADCTRKEYIVVFAAARSH